MHLMFGKHWPTVLVINCLKILPSDEFIHFFNFLLFAFLSLFDRVKTDLRKDGGDELVTCNKSLRGEIGAMKLWQYPVAKALNPS